MRSTAFRYKGQWNSWSLDSMTGLLCFKNISWNEAHKLLKQCFSLRYKCIAQTWETQDYTQSLNFPINTKSEIAMIWDNAFFCKYCKAVQKEMYLSTDQSNHCDNLEWALNAKTSKSINEISNHKVQSKQLRSQQGCLDKHFSHCVALTFSHTPLL